jgi:hypothetical protein
MNPKWIVYPREGDGYPVALDTATDLNHLRETCHRRLFPGPWETIRCSSVDTAQAIADWLNQRWEEKG